MAIQEIRVFEQGKDPQAEALRHQAAMMLGLDIDASSARVYLVEGTDEEKARLLAEKLFSDPNTQRVEVGPRTYWDDPLRVQRAMLPGGMNPDTEFVLKGAKLLGVDLVSADPSSEFDFAPGTPLDVVEQVTNKLIVNRTIQQVRRELPETLVIEGQTPPIEIEPVIELSESELLDLSQKRSLFLDPEEMKNIQSHFRRIVREPTDGELEYLGGAWSEHCCHKTFTAKIYKNGKEKDPLYKRLQDASRPYFGEEVISAYEDNSGVFLFYDGMCIAIKLETHNSPSAIEPYGGSMTGSGGVFRDIMGTGQGAKNILSIDIFCFAPTDLPAEQLPENCLSPAYLLQRCVDGVRDYGNRMGIPTANGSMHYHPDFRGKPTVMVGALGILPEQYARKGQPAYGDYVVSVGGKTGLDGIHGATFSSGSMTSETSSLHSSAVQIGNAIEEKRMSDALLEARDSGLIRAITDCGAAGFSSAIGEMGEEIGVQVDISRAPLKYEGLAPWQIWMSESQERMVAAVAPDKYLEFAAICAKHGVESTMLGTFGTDGGSRLDVKYGDEQLIDLDYDFIKGGRTQREMTAIWRAPEIAERVPLIKNWTETFEQLMAHGNIRSNEPIVRQYDHEVQGTNVMKPYGGVHKDSPNDAVVLTPILGKPYGLVEAHGMNPVLNAYDPYKGAKWAFAEALANYVAAGGNPDLAMLTDNFVAATPDEHVMGALDMMMDGLVDCIHAVKRPVISGKDSLSSRYKNKDGTHFDIPPVLTITAAGKIPDVAKTVSTDIKKANSTLVLVGKMDYASMGGSAFYDITDGSSAQIPDVDLESLPTTLRAVHSAIQTDQVLACHDVSEGGVAATIAEMCFGGDCGADIVVPNGLNEKNFLFNETAGCLVVEVDSKSTAQQLFGDVPHEIIGITSSEKVITVRPSSFTTGTVQSHFSVYTDRLKAAWKQPMQEFFS
ncbi:MAG TPA: AIR synthase-related protein [Candidatus Saccharimonadales bacterium]